MAKAQRKDEILKSELPPTLPLMALRSTIVYPLGTIAVQMGAPENLALLRAYDEPGLVVALMVAGGDHDDFGADHLKGFAEINVERASVPAAMKHSSTPPTQ